MFCFPRSVMGLLNTIFIYLKPLHELTGKYLFYNCFLFGERSLFICGDFSKTVPDVASIHFNPFHPYQQMTLISLSALIKSLVRKLDRYLGLSTEAKRPFSRFK